LRSPTLLSLFRGPFRPSANWTAICLLLQDMERIHAQLSLDTNLSDKHCCSVPSSTCKFPHKQEVCCCYRSNNSTSAVHWQYTYSLFSFPFLWTHYLFKCRVFIDYFITNLCAYISWSYSSPSSTSSRSICFGFVLFKQLRSSGCVSASRLQYALLCVLLAVEPLRGTTRPWAAGRPWPLVFPWPTDGGG
jgi:hypothetical protein